MSYLDHLTDSDFERLLHERAPRRFTKAAHYHLLQCRRCRVRLFVYDEALAGVYLEDMYGTGTAEKFRRQLKEPIDALSGLTSRWLELGSVPTRELSFWVANSESFHDVGTLTVVVEQAHALRKDAPRRAKAMLQAAIHALEKQADWPATGHAYLLTLAWTYLGNAHRILYELDESRAAFDKAHHQLVRAGSPADLTGQLSWMEGCLYKEQRDFQRALPLLESAVAKLALDGSQEQQVGAQITLAHAYGEAGLIEASMSKLESLIETFPAAAFPPDTFLALLHNLVIRHAQTKQPEKARALLPKVERLAREEGNRLDLVRVEWAWAEVYKAEGKRTPAAAGFREVTAKFMAAKIPVDAALAALSQADMYLELGDTQAAAELAEDLVPIFRAKGIHREATMAGLIVVENLRRETATAAQVQELMERLQGVDGVQAR